MNRRRDLQGRPLDLEAELDQARVTDRAIVAYLERIAGRDIERLRGLLLSAPVLHGMALGAKAVAVPDLRAKLVLRGHDVITALPLDWRVY